MTEPVKDEAYVSPAAEQFALVAVEFTKEYGTRQSGEVVNYDKYSAHHVVDVEDVATYVDGDYTFVPDEDRPVDEGATATATAVQPNLDGSNLAQVVLTPVPADSANAPEAKAGADAAPKDKAPRQ